MRPLFLDRSTPALSTLIALLAFNGCAAHKSTDMATEEMPGSSGSVTGLDEKSPINGDADPAGEDDEADAPQEQAAAPMKDMLRESKSEEKRSTITTATAATTVTATSAITTVAGTGGAPSPVAYRERTQLKEVSVAPVRSPALLAPPKTKAPAPLNAPSGVVASSPNTGAALGAGYAIQAPPPPQAPPADTVSSAEEYRDYGVNPFTMVAEDRLSTFSIDVDTASYTISRRKLQEERSLPPGSAVRVEEFVNFFKYDYSKPSSDPFSVSMEAMPDPFRPGHHLLRVGVQGKEIARNERPALHLTFLVDVSGSMASADKLGLAQHSMHLLVDGLREDDTVALATYAGRVAKILDPTSAGDARTIHKAIDSLQSGGSTAMSAGIDIAYDLAAKSFEPGHENRVVVLSDGDANVGNTSWDDMLSQIKKHADRGVTLSTIGFGMGNYKDTLMEQLANKGDGNNYYIDGKKQAERVFVSDLGGTMVTIARDTKIQVEFNPESVVAYRLVGYENRDIADKDFRNDRVDAGEVGSGHQVTALYDVVLKDGYAPTVATVRMRYEKPGADGVAAEKAFPFADRALKETPPLASRDTRIAYTAATFAEILRGSPHAAEIDINKLISFGKAAQRSGNKDDAELVALMERARDLGANGGSGMVSKR